MGEQKRHWLLTVHEEHLLKWDFDDVHGVLSKHNTFHIPFEKSKKVRYACGQLERCPSTGTVHHQIYVEFTESLRLSQVVKLFPSHAEPRLGTRTDAREYCTSEKYNGKDKGRIPDTVWEVGTWRQDVEGRTMTQKSRIIQAICVNGMTPKDIAKSDPEAFFSHYRAIEALYAAFNDISEFY